VQILTPATTRRPLPPLECLGLALALKAAPKPRQHRRRSQAPKGVHSVFVFLYQ
jgi:hypothetical protein